MKAFKKLEKQEKNISVREVVGENSNKSVCPFTHAIKTIVDQLEHCIGHLSLFLDGNQIDWLKKCAAKLMLHLHFRMLVLDLLTFYLLPTNIVVHFRHSNVISLILRFWFCFSEKEKPSLTSHPKPWLKTNSRTRHSLSYLCICHILTCVLLKPKVIRIKTKPTQIS